MPELDVVVIGAGFTGLTAASDIMNAGLDVCLLEASDRVGGKVESKILAGGTRVDTGGQFFCRDMAELMALIRESGRKPVMTHYDGEIVHRPFVPTREADARWQGVDALRDRMIATDPRDPALTRLTVADWVAGLDDVAADVKKSFLRMVTGLWCRDPQEISFLYLASNDRRITNTYSEMEMFLPDTLHALAEDLAAKLGDRLQLGMPATEIKYSAEGVEVTAGPKRIRARRAILALPPVIARKLDFSPGLPDRITKALAAWAPGQSLKLQVTYEKPFWREHGLSGAVMWQEPQGLYACDASRGDYAGLVVFIGGPKARHWHERPRAELIDFVRGQLTEAFGPEGANPLDIYVRDWVADTWCGGAYSDVIVDLDAADAEDALREGMPAIRFASSELALSYPGYVDGAIIAGQAVAKQVVADLQGR